MDLEEGKDSLVLRCIADANPPASIVWRRAGRSEIASLQVIFYFIYSPFFTTFVNDIPHDASTNRECATLVQRTYSQ